MVVVWPLQTTPAPSMHHSSRYGSGCQQQSYESGLQQSTMSPLTSDARAHSVPSPPAAVQGSAHRHESSRMQVSYLWSPGPHHVSTQALRRSCAAADDAAPRILQPTAAAAGAMLFPGPHPHRQAECIPALLPCAAFWSAQGARS